MIVTTPALRAAERVREQCSVYTNRWSPPGEPPMPDGPDPEKTLRLRAQIQARLARGMRQFEIADELGISRTTVGRHKRALEEVR